MKAMGHEMRADISVAIDGVFKNPSASIFAAQDHAHFQSKSVVQAVSRCKL